MTEYEVGYIFFNRNHAYGPRTMRKLTFVKAADKEAAKRMVLHNIGSRHRDTAAIEYIKETGRTI